MRAFLMMTLAALVLAGCSVSKSTARTSGVGFNSYGTKPAQAAPVEGNYRQALLNDLQA